MPEFVYGEAYCAYVTFKFEIMPIDKTVRTTIRRYFSLIV